MLPTLVRLDIYIDIYILYIDWFGSGPVKIDWLRLALIVSGSMIHFQDASAKAAKCREPQRIPKFTPQLHANFLIQQNQ